MLNMVLVHGGFILRENIDNQAPCTTGQVFLYGPPFFPGPGWRNGGILSQVLISWGIHID